MKKILIITLLVLTTVCGAKSLKNVYWWWDSDEDIAFKAIRRNDYPTFYRMVRKGVDLNVVDDHNDSLLTYGVFYSRPEMISLLLNKGADPNKYKLKGNYCNSPTLVQAARRGGMDICERLLKAGADPNIAGYAGLTPLIEAVRNGFYDIAERFLKAGADPNKASDWGLPLHIACQSGRTAIVGLLLRYGAKVNTLREGRTALAEAVKARSNAITISEMLLAADADVNLSKKGCIQITFPLYPAAESGNTELVELLLKHGADVNRKIAVPGSYISERPLFSSLSAALNKGYLPMIELLLKHGAKTTKKQLARIKELKINPKPVNPDLFKLNYNYELIKRAIAAGADINALDYSRQSLLERAAGSSIDLVKLLLKHGAKYKGYALGNAVASGNIDAVKLLLKHGADPNTVFRDPQRPTVIFCLNRNALTILPLLLKAGADIKQLNCRGQNLLAANCYGLRDAMVLRALIKAGADWRHIDRNGKTLVETIICNRNSSCWTDGIKILLDQGADRKKIRELAEKYKKKNLLFLLDNVWEKKSPEAMR
jgi:ankyrin repeat protein